MDISIPLSGRTVVWPGDPPLHVERVLDMDQGADVNVTRVAMSVHAGTHIDAPLHFLQHGVPIDRLDLSEMVGVARVIEVMGVRTISREDLERHRVRKGERILLRTDNSCRAWDTESFNFQYAHLSLEAAQYLAERAVRLVGIDYLSVAGMADGALGHRILLEAGIWLVESLDLRAVQPGSYDFVCLPLRIAGAEGAPARAIIRPRS
jgi:arylformamidase